MHISGSAIIDAILCLTFKFYLLLDDSNFKFRGRLPGCIFKMREAVYQVKDMRKLVRRDNRRDLCDEETDRCCSENLI